MTEPVIPAFQPRPEQLTREQLKGLPPEEVERLRQGGHLQDIMSGKSGKPAPPAPPRSS
jgi:hypothetical protein